MGQDKTELKRQAAESLFHIYRKNDWERKSFLIIRLEKKETDFSLSGELVTALGWVLKTNKRDYCGVIIDIRILDSSEETIDFRGLAHFVRSHQFPQMFLGSAKFLVVTESANVAYSINALFVRPDKYSAPRYDVNAYAIRGLNEDLNNVKELLDGVVKVRKKAYNLDPETFLDVVRRAREYSLPSISPSQTPKLGPPPVVIRRSGRRHL